MLLDTFMTDSFISLYDKEIVDYSIQSFDSFGVLEFLNNSTVIYKDFFEQIDLTFKYYRCNIYEWKILYLLSL